MKRPVLPLDGVRRRLDRVGEVLGRRRPTTRRGLAAAAGGAVIMVALLAVGLFVLGTAAGNFYDEYGYHPERNARAWAAREAAYADQGICQACHGLEHNLLVASRHEGIACESCHGPLRAHALANPATALAVTTPDSSLCASCHSTATGRPAGFPQVDLTAHYRSGVCLGCHDSHSTAAVRPPVVSHPLDLLPGCTVCHKPDGLKQLPTGHEPAVDAVCLGCHAVGADGGLDQASAVDR